MFCSAMARCALSRRLSTPTPGWLCPRATAGRRSVATIEQERPSLTRDRIALFLLAGLLAAALGIGVFLALRSPPQMGTDEEVFRTVDALFTAVTARDERLLAQCESRLHDYRAAGKLPPGAAD